MKLTISSPLEGEAARPNDRCAVGRGWGARVYLGLFFSAIFLFVSACQPEPKSEPIAKALTCGCPRVVVEGVIENRSENYFSNPKFVLKDASGEVEVRPWLPLEVAPYHPDVVEQMQRRGEKWPPETMAAYLGVPVKIYGRIEGNVLGVEYAERLK